MNPIDDVDSVEYIDFWILFAVNLKIGNQLILKMVPHDSSLSTDSKRFLKEEASNWQGTEREWDDMVSRMMNL